MQVCPKYTIHDKRILTSYRAAPQDISDYKRAVCIPEPESNSASNDNFIPSSLQQNIFRRIGERSDFMIEEQLKELIKTMKRESGDLIKMETVFECAGITKNEDVDLMLQSFAPFLNCDVCDDIESTYPYTLTRSLVPNVLETLSIRESQSNLKILPLEEINPQSHLPINEIEESMAMIEYDSLVLETGNSTNISPEIQNDTIGENSTNVSITDTVFPHVTSIHEEVRPRVHKGHPMAMDAAYVHKALKRFVLRYI